MNGVTPRLRMFAGPNGSGKTTIKIGLQRPDAWFGIYINPDDLEQTIRETGVLQLDPFGLTAETNEVRQHFRGSALLLDRQLATAANAIECQHGMIDFRNCR